MKGNLLDQIPLHSPRHSWDRDGDHVTIHMVHRGFYPFIAQKLFHTPKVSHIDLDQYGSFLWEQMDGQRTVRELAGLLQEQFGPETEPLYERLATYLKLLSRNQLIQFRKPSGQD